MEALACRDLYGDSANIIINKPSSFLFFFSFCKEKDVLIKLEDIVLPEFGKRF